LSSSGQFLQSDITTIPTDPEDDILLADLIRQFESRLTGDFSRAVYITDLKDSIRHPLKWLDTMPNIKSSTYTVHRGHKDMTVALLSSQVSNNIMTCTISDSLKTIHTNAEDG